MKFINTMTIATKLTINIARYYSQVINTKIFNNKQLELGEQKLLEHKYEAAANIYSNWLKEENIIDEIKNSPSNSTLKNKFEEYLPNILHAFLGCPCDDGCKDHVEDIVSNGYLDFRDFIDNNILHLAAHYNQNGNHQVYSDLLKLIKEEQKTDMLLQKNLADETPIEVAFLKDNKDFLKLTRAICGKPQIEDFKLMENLGYYAALKSDSDPEIVSLLLGEEIVSQSTNN